MTKKNETAALVDRIDGIIFEGDVVRAWIVQLRRRAIMIRNQLKTTKPAALHGEKAAKLEELKTALSSLDAAEQSLGMFEAAVAKREGKA